MLPWILILMINGFSLLQLSLPSWPISFAFEEDSEWNICSAQIKDTRIWSSHKNLALGPSFAIYQNHGWTSKSAKFPALSSFCWYHNYPEIYPSLFWMNTRTDQSFHDREIQKFIKFWMNIFLLISVLDGLLFILRLWPPASVLLSQGKHTTCTQSVQPCKNCVCLNDRF